MTTKLRECLGLKTVAADKPNASPDYIAGASHQHCADEKALWEAIEDMNTMTPHKCSSDLKLMIIPPKYQCSVCQRTEDKPFNY